MPSPVTHIAVAVVMAARARRRATAATLPPAWKVGLVCVFFSLAPDLDAVVGLITGDMGAYHNQISHSFFFGLAVCLAATPLLRPWLRGYRAIHIFGLTYGCYALHLALDWMTYGRGLQLFWPLTDQRFLSPYQLFYGVRWSQGLINNPLHWVTLQNELMVGLAAGTVFVILRQLWRWKHQKT